MSSCIDALLSLKRDASVARPRALRYPVSNDARKEEPSTPTKREASHVRAPCAEKERLVVSHALRKSGLSCVWHPWACPWTPSGSPGVRVSAPRSDVGAGKVYQEVFAHNDQLVAELVRKVLEADKIIHEQQLGLGWREPSKSIYKSPWEGVAEEAEEAADTQGAENEEREAAREIAERLRDPQYSGMLSMLINEAGFLVESRARAEIERVPGDEQGRRMIKHILDSLGVMNGELFDRLVQVRVLGALRQAGAGLLLFYWTTLHSTHCCLCVPLCSIPLTVAFLPRCRHWSRGCPAPRRGEGRSAKRRACRPSSRRPTRGQGLRPRATRKGT